MLRWNRTPLNSVVVLSDLLLEAKLDPILYECMSFLSCTTPNTWWPQSFRRIYNQSILEWFARYVTILYKASTNGDWIAKSYIAVIRDVLVCYLHWIHQHSQHRLLIATNFQDFSRLETKSVILEHLPFDLTELIDGTLDQLSEVAANKNIG